MRRHAKSSAAPIATGATRLGILGSLFALICVAALVLGAFASQAELYSLGQLGSFANPAGLAVNETSGNLYVADQGSNSVQVYDSSGAFLRSFGKGVNATTAGDICTAASGDSCQVGSAGSSNGAFDNPLGVAIDQGTGDVYVVDSANRRIEKFDEDGNYLAKFGSPGTGNGEFSAWPDGSFIAVGPGGNVFVGDGAANPRIEKFDSTGAFVEDFTAINSSGAVYGLALDSAGKIYDDDGQSAVHKLDAAGAPEYDLAGVSSPKALATDSASDDVYVADSGGTQILQFDDTGAQVGGAFGSGVIGSSRGLAYDPGAAVLYVSDSGCGCVRSFGTPATTAPQIVSQSSSNAGVNSATLEAQINPEGADTTYYFEYGETAAYGQTQPAPPGPSIGEGFTAQPVSQELTGLEPNKTYHFRVVAINAEGTTEGSDQTLATTPPPTIVFTSARDLTATSATLGAAIDPHGLATTYRFEYGTTTAYGQTQPASGGDLDLADLSFGSEGGASLFYPSPSASTTLSGLSPDTLYHYRVVATSSAGETPGPDKVMHTFPLAKPFELPDNRAYEMVSPPEKNGGDIAPFFRATRSSDDGDAVTYISPAAFADAGGTGINVEYMATRGADGWSTHALTPSQPPTKDHLPSPNSDTAYQSDLTGDLGAGVIAAKQPLTDAPNVETVINLYLRPNLRSGGPRPEEGANYELLTDSETPQTDYEGGFQTSDPKTILAGVSSSMSHILFESAHNLLAGAEGTNAKLYEWDEGTQRLAGILPNGEVAEGSMAGNGAGVGTTLPNGNYYGIGAPAPIPNVVSDDGSRVVFTGPPYRDEDTSYRDLPGTLYVRENHSVTIRLDESERTTPETSPSNWGNAFRGASTDGSRVFFKTKNQLVDEDENSSYDLYMYDFAKPVGERLSVISLSELCGCAAGDASEPKIVQISEDGSFVYFTHEGGPLTSEATDTSSDGERLYVWHEGDLRYADAFLNTYSGVDASPAYEPSLFDAPDSRISADGESVLFATTAPVSREGTISDAIGYDTSPSDGKLCPGRLREPLKSNSPVDRCIEVYLYRYATDQLVCVSCNPSFGSPTGDAGFRVLRRIVGGGPSQTASHQPHALSADGSRAFFSSPDRLVPEDTNGRMDAYEYDVESGELHLLSTGECDCDSYFVEASPSGEDVFVTTNQRLVGIDRDRNTDLYDVRVGGGIAAQNPVGVAQCEGDACQSAEAPLLDPTPASASFAGAGNQHAHRAKKHKRRGHRKARHHHKRQHGRANAKARG